MEKERDGIKKALDISQVIRKQSKLDIHSKDHYVKACENVATELSNATAFLSRASDTPLLFFTDTQDAWGSHKNIIYEAIRRSHKTTKVGTVHQFQSFIATRLNEYFQAWIQDNNIEITAVIECRSPSTFPSIFAVYVDDYETVQFNILDKFYGAREVSRGEESILLNGQRREKELRGYIKEDQAKLEKYIAVKKKPFSVPFSLRWYFEYIFRHKLTIKKLDGIIEKIEKDIESTNKDIEDNREKLPLKLADNKLKQHGLSLVEPFFQSLNYELETKRYRLY